MVQQTSPDNSLENRYWQLLDCPSDDARQKLLTEIRASNPEQAAALEKMLAAADEAAGFMALDDNSKPEADELAGTVDTPASRSAPAMKIPKQIGPYKLLVPIGQGGMGLVYLAQQSQPVRRKVALKIIKPGMDSRQVIARFEAERQALAMMEHPNIAKVLDAGTTESGLPFFVMELVRGIPITEYCDRSRMDLRQRLKLFYDACAALQHAHNKGIIHRDIKPSNVLVTEHDGTPVVKVIDFGVAKALTDNLTDKTLYTGVFQMIGTPLYMSPEQASLSNLDVDVRSDVYSLGVLLYELVSGTLPIDRDSAREMSFEQLRKHICDSEPPCPSRRLSTLRDEGETIVERGGIHRQQLVKSLAGELDWIVMKAIEKDRGRRYQSARELSDNVTRHLNGDAVEACPPSWAYRLSKAYRRRRSLFVAAAGLCAVLFAGVAGTAWQAYRATIAEADAEADAEARLEALELEQANTQSALHKAELAEAEQRRFRTLAEESERDAKWRLYVANHFAMRAAWRDGDFGKLKTLLKQSIPAAGEQDYRGWERYFLQSELENRVQSVQPGKLAVAGPFAWCEATRQIAAASAEHSDVPNPKREFFVWDHDRAELRWKGETDSEITALAFSPDGAYLAAGTRAGRLFLFDSQGNRIAIMDPICDVGSRWVKTIAWKPDGSKLAYGCYQGAIAIYDALASNLEILRNQEPYCGCLDWHPTENLLAAGLRFGERRIYDLDNATSQVADRVSTAVGQGVAWSPDGTQLALSEGKNVRIVDRDLQPVIKLVGHHGAVQDLAWLNENVLVTAAADHTIRYWDVETGDELRTISAHSSNVSWLAIDQKLQACLSAETDLAGVKRTHTAGNVSSFRRLSGPDGDQFSCRRLVWSPDGSRLAAVGASGTEYFTGVWSANGTKPIAWSLGELSRSVDWSRDGNRLLRHDDRGLLGIVDPGTGMEIAAYPELDVNGRAVATNMSKGFLSPSGSRIANLNSDGFFLHAADSLELLGSFSARMNSAEKPCVVWSPDERQVLVAGWDTPAIYAINDTIERRTLELTPSFSGSWHANSQLLVLGAASGQLYFFDAVRDKLLYERPGHRGAVKGVGLSPDGRRLASGGDDGVVAISDVATGDELFRVQLPDGDATRDVAWSPDGFQLAVGTSSAIYVWSVRPDFPLPESQHYLATGNVFQRLTETASSVPFTTPVSASPWKHWYTKLQTVDHPKLNADSDSMLLQDLFHSVTPEDWNALVPALRNWLEDQPSAERSVELATDALAALDNIPTGATVRELRMAQSETARCLTRSLVDLGDFAAAYDSNALAIAWAEENLDHQDVTAEQWLHLESTLMDQAWIITVEARDRRAIEPGDPGLQNVLNKFDSIEASLSRFPSWARLVKPSIQINDTPAAWRMACVQEWIEQDLAQGRISESILLLNAWHRGTDFYSLYKSALCYAAAGDEQNYRALCKQMLEQFASSQAVNELAFVVWTCALLPNAVEDYQVAIDLIERACEIASEDAVAKFYHGAILVRAGRYQAARKILTEVENLEGGTTSPAYRWLFQALLELKAGEMESGREFFERAEAFIVSSRDPAHGDKQSASWNRQTTQILLLEEVRRKLVEVGPVINGPVDSTNFSAEDHGSH